MIAEKLGAKLVGIYSCEEVGYVATECPVAAHYHICSEMTFVEIVDDAGLPVAPGQPGRVLVTGLYNYATPFIRYDIGDVAIADPEPCSLRPVVAGVVAGARANPARLCFQGRQAGLAAGLERDRHAGVCSLSGVSGRAG